MLLCYKSIRLFFTKPGGFQLSALAWGDLELSYAYVIFFRLSIASADDKPHLSEVVFSALVGFALQGKWLNSWSSALDSDFFWRKTRLLWFAWLLTLLISGDIARYNLLCQRFFQSSLLISSFWYSLEIFQRCSFYLLDRSNSPSFHGSLQFWKQQKVAEDQVWSIRWPRHDYSVVISQKN